MALGFFCCCMLRSPKEGSSKDSETEPQESTNLLLQEPPGRKRFIFTVAAKPELQLYLLSKVFIYLALTIPPLLVPSLLVQRGYSTDKAGYAMSILGITNVFGRLSGGLADYITDHAIKICIFACCNTWCCTGAAILLHPLFSTWLFHRPAQLFVRYLCKLVNGYIRVPGIQWNNRHGIATVWINDNNW